MATKSRPWLLTLFALLCLAAGIGMLLLSVLPTLYDWSRMQSWLPTQAQLLSAQLHTHPRRSGPVYNVSAHYRYRHAGQDYTAQRVAINAMNDNLGDFQRRLGRRLESAHQNKRPIRIWVNPAAPAEAVIDRSLRSGLLMFQSAFVLLFAGIGLGMLYVARRERRPAPPHPAMATQPWLARPEWAGNRIRSQQNLAMRVAWVFALVWNLIAIPTAIEVVPKALERDNHAALLVLLFPLLGLFLLTWAINITRSARRFGDVSLELDPFPGAIGGHFGASLLLPITASSAQHFAVTLNCINFHEVESGGERESHERLVWQAEGIATVHSNSNGIRLSFRFAVPPDLPASGEVSRDYHGWRLDIESRNPDLEFARRFDVPVFATGEQASRLHQNADTHPQMRDIHAAQINSVCNIERLPDGLRLNFPFARNWKTALPWLAFGLAFAGFGALTRVLGAPLLFPIAFGTLGLTITLASIFSLANSLRVQIDRRGLQTEQRLFGVLIARRQADARDITRLQLQQSYSMQSGGKHQNVYRITATLANGKQITLAKGLRGQASAQQLLAMISAQSGYPANQGNAE